MRSADAARARFEIAWAHDPAEHARRGRSTRLWITTLTLLALAAAVAFAWERTHADSAIPQAVVWLVPIFGWLPLQALRLWAKASRRAARRVRRRDSPRGPVLAPRRQGSGHSPLETARGAK